MVDGRCDIVRMSTTDMPIDVLDLMHQFHLFLTQFLAQLLQCDQFILTLLIVLVASLLFHRFQIFQLIFQRLIGGLKFSAIIQYGIRFGKDIDFCEILSRISTN